MLSDRTLGHAGSRLVVASPACPAPLVDPVLQTGAPLTPADPGIALASNGGSDFTIGMPFVIAAVVLQVGLVLLIMVTRLSKAKHRR